MAVVLITGINSGMGFTTAKKLLQQGHSILGTVRNQEKSKTETDALEKLAGAKLAIYEMNFASMQSVKNCAKQISETNEQIDVFIFNAGIMTSPD